MSTKIFQEMRNILLNVYRCDAVISKKKSKYSVSIVLDNEELAIIEFNTTGKVYVTCRKCGQSDSIKVSKDAVYGFAVLTIKEISKKINYPWFLMNIDCDYDTFDSFDDWANSLADNRQLSKMIMNIYEQKSLGKDISIYDLFLGNKCSVSSLFDSVSRLSNLVCGG